MSGSERRNETRGLTYTSLRRLLMLHGYSYSHIAGTIDFAGMLVQFKMSILLSYLGTCSMPSMTSWSFSVAYSSRQHDAIRLAILTCHSRIEVCILCLPAKDIQAQTPQLHRLDCLPSLYGTANI